MTSELEGGDKLEEMKGFVVTGEGWQLRVWKAMNKGGTGLAFEKNICAKIRNCSQEGGEEKMMRNKRNLGGDGINSAGGALEPMGKCSGVSPCLEGGDKTSRKKICCYF